MELVNTHAHTGLCGHGEGTVDELVRAARAAGISTLAVTEHYPLTPAFDPLAYLSMPKESIGRYLRELEDARAAYPDIEIVFGTELDWLGDYEDRALSAEDFAPFACVLGSVHSWTRGPSTTRLSGTGGTSRARPTSSGGATSRRGATRPPRTRPSR